MKEKIIFLISQPLNDRNIKRFGLNFLNENNWDVECWNLFYLDKTNQDNEKFKNLKFKYKKFFNIKDFISAGLNIKKSFYYIDFVGISFVLGQLFLSIKGGKRIAADFGLLPSIPTYVFYNNFTRYKILNVLLAIIYKIQKKIMSVFLPIPYFFFSSGKLGKDLAIKRKNPTIIEAHNLDYDNYLELNEQLNVNIENNYILYIDQYFENSIDLKMDKLKFNEIDRFKKKLINFFNFCKEKYNYDTVIAANPRRYNENNCFFPYKLVFNETHDLIRNSKIVLAHNSTAIQIAILFNKPIILLTSEELLEIPQIHKQIEAFSEELNIKTLKLENYNNLDFKHYFLDKSRYYGKYIEKYIKSKSSKNKKFWEILNSNLKKKHIN